MSIDFKVLIEQTAKIPTVEKSAEYVLKNIAGEVRELLELEAYDTLEEVPDLIEVNAKELSTAIAAVPV
jgi:hypothetical protein